MHRKRKRQNKGAVIRRRALFARAMMEGSTLWIAYSPFHRPEGSRAVTPICFLVNPQGAPGVLAWCHLREAPRRFHLNFRRMRLAAPDSRKPEIVVDLEAVAFDLCNGQHSTVQDIVKDEHSEELTHELSYELARREDDSRFRQSERKASKWATSWAGGTTAAAFDFDRAKGE